MIIKNGMIIDVNKDRLLRADIVIKDGIIERITDEDVPASSDIVIDATGMYIAPGLVDTHVHFRDPGFTEKEDIITGASAAAKGGFTQVVMMANTKPSIDNVETLKYVLEKGAKTGINVHTCANVTLGMKGEELTDMFVLKDAGAIGFTDDGIPLMDEEKVKEAMRMAWKLNVPISFHEENKDLISENGINAGMAADYYHVKGSPREAEISMITRDIELMREVVAEKTATEGTTEKIGTAPEAGSLFATPTTPTTPTIPTPPQGPKVVIQHISTKEGVELVRKAKQEGLNIHAEATPHHFALTEMDVIRYGANAKMNPPLRTEEDRMAIIEGLKDGTIDIIATDHAPHTKEEKEKPITEAPSGIIGLETSLSLAIQHLVNIEHMTYPKVMKLMSQNPCKLYGLEGGAVEEGLNADLIIFEPAGIWEVSDFESKASNSPFIGRRLPGVINYTICNGQIVYMK